MRRSVALAAVALLTASYAGCSFELRQPQTLEVEYDDPIAATFENCADLFKPHANGRECDFQQPPGRRYDVVEEKISCIQKDADVACQLRPGAGPAGSQLMNCVCRRTSRKCRSTAGNLGFTSAYARLFEEHNAGLKSDQATALPDSR